MMVYEEDTISEKFPHVHNSASTGGRFPESTDALGNLIVEGITTLSKIYRFIGSNRMC